MKDILLSFLEIAQQQFSFIIYRKPYDDAPKTDDSLWVYKLPDALESTTYASYYVSLVPETGFSAFRCEESDNLHLTKRILMAMLTQRVEALNLDHSVRMKKFYNSLEVYTDDYPKGRRAIVFQPYFLQHSQKFGFLIDARFRAHGDHPRLDVEMQKLSFSLDRSGAANRNYYADKFNYSMTKLGQLLPALNPLQWGTTRLTVAQQFTPMPVTALAKKLFVFKNGNTDYIQFNGVRRFGPFQEGPAACMFVFIMEERFKNFANNLFLSLIGKKNPDTFQGMKQMFQVDIGKENVQQIRLQNTSEAELQQAVAAVAQARTDNPDRSVIAVFIEENNHAEEEGVSETYYYLKYHLTRLQIPVQVLSHEKISVEKTLKWSTSNIGLALFAKLGGIPWVVRPSISNCLILGIGSAHKRGADGSIERYFAYSVCLDSSGIYRKLEVLADDHSHESYLQALQRNLVALLRSPEFASYTKCALHLPFKIKFEEINSIKAAIATVRNIEFKVLKINVKNKFMGFSEHNTRTPYASTLLELNAHEFLVWFEGLHEGKEVLNERISPPVHIEFLNSEHTSKESVYPYLQDVINLTGTNWRGFNAKVKPISIYYSEIIARYCTYFEDFDDFRKDMLSLDTPWFL
jgi:hypothetical protein